MGREQFERLNLPPEWNELTRRRFLIWAGGTAAVAATLSMAGCSQDNSVRSAGDDDNVGFEQRNLYLSVPRPVTKIATGLTFVTSTGEYPVSAIGKESLAKFRGENRLGSLLDKDQVNHFVGSAATPDQVVGVTMSSKYPTLGVVYGKVAGKEVILGLSFTPPKAAALQVAKQSLQVNSNKLAQDARLHMLLGKGHNVALTDAQEVADMDDIQHLLGESAAAMFFCNPSVITADGDASAVTKQVINSTGAVPALAAVMLQFAQKNRSPWGVIEDMVKEVDADGDSVPQTWNPLIGISDYKKPDDVQFPDIPEDIATGTAKTFQPFVRKGMKWKGIEVDSALINNFKNTFASTQNDVLNLVQDTPDLCAIIKPEDDANSDPGAFAEQMTGKAVAVTPGIPTTPVFLADDTKATDGAALMKAGNADVNFTIKGSPSWAAGMRAEITDVKSKDGATAMTVRVWNNQQRAIVFGAQFNDGRNVPIMPPEDRQMGPGGSGDPTWNIQSKFLESVPLIAGVPILGTNYVDIDIYMPTQAVTTRLVAGTMGTMAGWRKNFMAVKTDANGNEVIGPDGKPVLYEAYQPVTKDGKTDHYTHPSWYNDAVIVTAVTNLGMPAFMVLTQVIALGGEFKALSLDPKKDRKMVIDESTDIHGDRAQSVYFEDYTRQDMERLSRAFQASAGLSTLMSALTGITRSQTQMNLWDSIWMLAKVVLDMLAMYIFAKPLKAYFASLLTANATKLIPIVGVVYTATAVANNTSELTQAAISVSTQPGTVVWEIVGTYTTTITAKPDGTSTFSKSAAAWVLKIYYIGCTEPTVIYPEGYNKHIVEEKGRKRVVVDPIPGFDSGPRSEPLEITVPNVLFGGAVQYTLEIQSKDGWTVGTSSTEWLPNSDVNSITTTLDMPVKQKGVAVNADSTYERRFTTALREGKYSMATNADVPGTIDSTKMRLGSIAVGEGTGLMSYVYEQSGKWFVRQLAASNQPGSGEAELPKVFEGVPPMLAVDPLSSLGGRNATNWLLEPIGSSESDNLGYHVRKLNLSPDKFGVSKESFGRFTIPLTSVSLSPGGHLVGVNSQHGLMSVLLPSNDGGGEDEAPVALQLSGPGNRTGARPGLLQKPVAVTVAGNGTVVVLEQSDEVRRLQAFDLAGNPVMAFRNSPTVNNKSDNSDASYYVPLDDGYTYLDAGTDGEGYVFVLGYKGDGSKIGDYVMDVFAPGAQDRLFRVDKVNAGRMAIGYFRDVYSLNFDQIGSGDSKAAKSPSQSIWVARTPNWAQ